MKIGIAGAAILVLAACSPPDDMSDNAAAAAAKSDSINAPAAADVPAPPEPPKVPDGSGVVFNDNAEVEGGAREFSYEWPKQVSAIPALAKELETQRDKALAEQKQWWAESLADCPPDFTACRNSTFELGWQVVADLPRYLSLSSGFYSYTGGAHGNSGRGSLIWDRKAGAAIDPKAMFTSLDALDAAISDTACKRLNRERSERRGGEEFRTEGEWPNQCVSMEETVMFMGSSSGQKFDRIGIYYAPYVAGAYAEGDYEFTVPVTRQIIDAVKPVYREAFAPGK
ncbi:DUF3298 and DUF4163 domain-containing protein [Erythrobacter insulae]|nr:DUF3298 and DUF4163 domain-containing protein [Erythrobacter insulae]